MSEAGDGVEFGLFVGDLVAELCGGEVVVSGELAEADGAVEEVEEEGVVGRRGRRMRSVRSTACRGRTSRGTRPGFRS